MKLATKIITAVGLAAVLATKPLLAGDGKTFKEKVIVEEEARKWWGASLSTGWDSLYMFRGVNVLRGDQKYGSSLYWTDLNLVWNITDNDFLTAGTWMAFGLNKTNYKELDVYVDYTHTFGNLAVSFGYIYYQVLSDNHPVSHELNWRVAYTFELPAGITITPSVGYYFNIGPDVFDIIALAPWFAFGTSFEYNVKENGDFLTGANNIEIGIGLPIKINDVISLYGYGAYSYQWYGLIGTEPSTFWGGAKVTFSF
jgi:hypothetical protein